MTVGRQDAAKRENRGTTHDPTAHRRRRPRGRRVQDGRLVRVQQPRSTGAGDGQPDPRRGRSTRLQPAPGGADADPAPDADDRGADPAGAVGRLLEPVLRGVHRRRRGGGRGVRLCAPLHLAAARLAGPGDEPGDRRRRGRHRPARRPSGGRGDQAGRGADRARRLDRAGRSRLDRGRRRGWRAGGGGARHRSGPSRHPDHRGRAAAPITDDGGGRRHRPAAARLSRGVRGGRRRDPGRAHRGRPGQHRRRHRRTQQGAGGTASARQPSWR